MIYYGCPKCGAAMASPESMAGQSETCPECGNIATVPVQAPPAPHPAPQAAQPAPPPAQPAPQPAQPTVVHVHAPQGKSVSGLGITALVLGIIAILGSWIPFINFISIFFAGLGFIFGAIGFFLALTGRKAGTGMPAAGVIVCIVALIISIWVTVGTVKAIDEALSVDEEIVLRWADDPQMKILGATDLASYEAVLEASNSKDAVARRELLDSGRAYLIEPGTKAIILESGLFRHKVRLLSGTHADKVLWVPMEVIHDERDTL